MCRVFDLREKYLYFSAELGVSYKYIIIIMYLRDIVIA